MVEPPPNFRRQDSRRTSSEATKSEKSIGVIVFQIPFGPRKSGIPDSVLMPAPVKTTIFSAASNIALSSTISVPLMLASLKYKSLDSLNDGLYNREFVAEG